MPLSHTNYSTLLSCDPTMVGFVQNMTAPYADKSNESSVVAISVIMFILAAVFFDLNLFSRVSRVSAVLNPTVRLFLAGSLNLFLPVMSYLFSEAKKDPAYDCGSGNNLGESGASESSNSDLSLLARVILTWMLLVELLRKKVEATLVTGAGMQGYSSIITHTASVVWMGNLVFTNLKASGKKALFGILWVLCAAKLVQRVAITETARRSLAHGKNARLISSYMAQLPKLRPVLHGGADASSLEQCEYAVMGEENMVVKAGPQGYELDLSLAATDAVVTVGKIWQSKDHPRMKRLCLSFALFKLLRRRFENLPPATKQETDECRDLILDGMCKDAQAAGDIPAEVALFQVLNDEVNFVTEYYHSVLPVVFASPYFIVVNYLCFPVVVFGLCVMTIVLCSNGVIIYAFQSLRDDNFAVSKGIISLTECLWKNVIRSPRVFFSIIDVSICYLLFIAVIYEEVSEFIVLLLSDWFMVSLLSTFCAKPRWRQSTTFRTAFRCVVWVRRNLRRYPSLITIKQLSVLRTCSLSAMTLPTATLPKRAKRSILERFRGAAQDDGGGSGGAAPPPLSNGRTALSMDKHRDRFYALAWACESGGVAEVILIWHIATTLLERKHSPQPEGRRSRRTAVRLSRYCAYLVAFRPELLPGDREGTKRVYKDMKEQLKAALGGTRWSYYFSSERTRHDKVQAIPDKLPREYPHADMTVIDMTPTPASLVDEAGKAGNNGGAAVWEMLADVWVELVVYVSPSSVEEHAKGHEEALVQGGELVTLLWVLATHTGIARPDDDDEVDQPAPAFV
ncbi:hypothetical protein E2562_016256 [Oryza meyeriana var. granulata]|uniref:DUF4220 domain-containing protein n=1 Tax=Oryza meyeriana var. granulata TaxID=110450 RepID=A0A6G1CQT0_9ORYZ|nr:hypothetical protein E2562_016256 [Oryza meyeriana var. granulata]